MEVVQYLQRKLPVWTLGVKEPRGCGSPEFTKVPKRRQTILASQGDIESKAAICDYEKKLSDEVPKAVGGSWQ
jgi:hypothetical protein